jgi:microcystin-dependent protein
VGDYFLGEIRMFTCNFAPRGWAFCNGQTFPQQQYQALYSLLGSRWGSATTPNFCLPDLRGRLAVQQGPTTGYPLTQNGGAEGVVLLSSQIPQHTHTVAAASTGTTANNAATGNANTLGVPQPNKAGTSKPFNIYGPSSASVTALEGGSIAETGGNVPHPNLQPYQAINFCISLTGIYPTRE